MKYKKGKLIMLLSLSALMLLFISGCSDDKNTSTDDKDKVFELNLGHVVSSQSNSWHGTITEFVEAVEEESDGRLKINVFPDGQLGGDLEMIQQMKMGDLDMGLISGAAHSPIIPEMAIENLPFAFPTNQDAYDKMDGELGEQLFGLLEEENIKGLAWWESGPFQITNNTHPINKPEDLEGLKIRVPEIELRQESFKSLGANPIPMAFTELFSALQQGTIDGQTNPSSIVHSSNFYEVQEYLSILNVTWSSAILEMNLETWDELPQDLQEIISENAIKFRDVQRERIQEEEESVITELEDAGMKINTVEDLTPFVEATQPIYDKYRDVFGEELMDLILD